MKRTLFVLALILSVSASVSAADIFARLDNIRGGSTDAAHKDWIDVRTIDCGRTSTGVSAFVFTKKIDGASGELLNIVSGSKPVKEARIEIMKGGVLQGRIRMSDCVIKSIKVKCDETTGNVPVEEVTMSPLTYVWDYK